MKTLIASAVLALTTVGAFAQFPGYADMNRDGVVTATEYQDYAFDRADENGNHYIDPSEQVRYDRLIDLDQEF